MKKALKFILVIAIIAGGYFGYTAIQDAKANEPLYNPNGEQLVEADEPVLVGTLPFLEGNGVDFAFDYDEISKLLSSTTAKYMWIEEVNEEGMNHNVYSVSEEYLIKNLKEAHKNHPHPNKESFETAIIGKVHEVRELAEIVIDNLTSLNGTTSTGTVSSCYITTYMGNPWQALDGGSVDTDFPVDTFKRDQLDLDISNTTASTVICGNKRLAGYPTQSVLVHADVTTLNNSGKYKNIKWIPEKGETNSVDFLISFSYMTVNGAGNCLFIDNVAVLNYSHT